MSIFDTLKIFLSDFHLGLFQLLYKHIFLIPVSNQET